MSHRPLLAWSRALKLLALLSCSLAALAQQPPPGYNSPWRNADGSEKFAIAFSGGWDISTGSSRVTQTRGWNYTMAAGRNLNRHLALLGEYSFYHFSLPPVPGALTLPAPVFPYGPPETGNTHIWSLTAESEYQYAATERAGAYLLVGGGLYRRSFSCGSSCEDGFTGAAAGGDGFFGGANAGTGVAFKVSENANVKAFFEVRYVWIDTTSQVLTTTATNGTRTSFIPATAGLRW
jgi:hypothetical protein